MIKYKVPDQEGYILLKVSKQGEELLAKAGIANAESLLPQSDADLSNSIAKSAGVSREQFVEALRSRNFKKRMGLYVRLWEQFAKELKKR